MSVKEKPPDDFFKCVKVSLKHVLKNHDINQSKINDVVIKAHKIVIHTLQFMKLYLLDYYDKNNTVPKIDKVFINSCMKILCKEKATGRPAKVEIQTLKDNLTKFYNKHYKPLCQKETLDYTYMNTILDYLTIDILTMYENNIKLHYIDYVERYVNVIWRKKEMIKFIKRVKKTKKDRNDAINKLCSELRKIKNDLLDIENKDYKSNKIYHDWIDGQKTKIKPNKNKFKKNNLHYDLQCVPQEYLKYMIYMMKEVEKAEYSISNVFPLRSDIQPKHIRIDTTTLVHLLLTKKQGNKSKYLFDGNLKRYEDKIWKFFFRTERQCFKKKWYSFHHMIETDSVGCSIIFLRKDKVGKRIPPQKGCSNEQYIDELKDYSGLKDKNIVAIDPNLADLLYCVDSDKRDRNFFRYTQDQRRKETKQKKYQNIILEKKDTKIRNKTIIRLETELSEFNRKTLNIKEFKKYIKKKNQINKKLFRFYENKLFRKLKLNGYWNRLKSEQNMVNRFKKIFGKPDDTIIAIGDFEQKKHRKYKEPLKGKGFRTLFRKSGYQVYLVDEFRTSCKCSNCNGGDCEKFRKCRNPKPMKNDFILSHGALICKKCSALWNRDENSSRNIYKIAHNAINQKERPKYLSRSKDCKAVVSGTASVCGLQRNSVKKPHKQNLRVQ
jgi:hypothetical protein